MAGNYIEQRDEGFYIKGTRVPLDSIVHEFLQGASPESIRQAFPTLTLEQVYGAVAFYLGNREKVDASIRETERSWSEFGASNAVPQETQQRLREARVRMSPRHEK